MEEDTLQYIRDSMDAAGRAGRDAAKQRAPFVTGFLRNSITWIMTAWGPWGAEGELRSSAPYAAAQNWGVPGKTEGGSPKTGLEVPRGGGNGTVTVNQHGRAITTVFGKPIQPTRVFVTSHSRNMNIRPTFFFTRGARVARRQLEKFLRQRFG